MTRRAIGLCMFLLLASAGEAEAQQRGFFVEPQARASGLLGQAAVLVGVRTGYQRAAGFGFYAGLDVLTGGVATEGTFMRPGDEVDRLVQASLAARWHGRLGAQLRYDLGLVGVAGLSDGLACGGTDSCEGGGPFVGGGPEVGLAVVLGRFGLRVFGGYTGRAVLIGPQLSAPAVGVGVRVR